MLKVYCSLIIVILISCNKVTKRLLIDTPSTYYTITEDGIQTITIYNDSLGYSRIAGNIEDVYDFDSAGYVQDSYKQKIVEQFFNNLVLEIYVDKKKKIQKKIYQFDTLKNKISVLIEDTLFKDLKSAKSYRPDLNKKFLFDYYTKAYLLEFKNKPKIYNCDSSTIYEFIGSFKKILISSKPKIKNNFEHGGTAHFLVRDLLNKTFISMSLNPFVTTDSLDPILNMIPTED